MPELGKKHECVSCDARFYDLGRTVLICPKCGSDQKEDPDSKEAATTAKKKSKKGTKKKTKKK